MSEVDSRSGNALPESDCSGEPESAGNNGEKNEPAGMTEIPAIPGEYVAQDEPELSAQASEKRYNEAKSQELNDGGESLVVIEPVPLEVKSGSEESEFDRSEGKEESERKHGEELSPKESERGGDVEDGEENGLFSEGSAEVLVVEEVQEVEESEGNGEAVTEIGRIDDETTAKQEETVLDELETVNIEPHWLPKFSIRVTVNGGSVTEEELSSLLKEHCTISSITFENDKGDAAIICFDSILEDDQLVTRIQEKTKLELGERTLNVKAYHSDALLFVGNLTLDIDDTSLRSMFEPHGKIERAFVLRNSVGRSKGYGFVEYSLKSQAFIAKSSMSTMNMDGRVLRIEWSHSQSVKDMFSAVLFVDRITKRMPNVESSLRTLFGQFGKVKDCCLAIGINGSIRGFGFIDFVHSACADKAKQALDGQEFGGLNLRVSFANPSKPAQSYKKHLIGQAPVAPVIAAGRGTPPGMHAPVRGTTDVPYGGNEMIGVGRLAIRGSGSGMPLNRGLLGSRVHNDSMSARGSGMLGSFPPGAGIMGWPPCFTGHGLHLHAVSSAAAPQDLYRQRQCQAHFDQPKQLRTRSYHQQSYQRHSQQSFVEQPHQKIQGWSGSYQQPAQPSIQLRYQPPQQQSRYHSQSAESYVQSYQHQPSQQYTQGAGYYQQQPTPQDQYALQYGQAHGQAPISGYGQPAANDVQTYQQTGVPYTSDPYAQPMYQGAPKSNSQQQAFCSNYQQQTNYPQSQQQLPQNGPPNYYKQPVASTGGDVGQKRVYEQMDAPVQNYAPETQYGGYPSGYQQAGQVHQGAAYQQASGYSQQPHQAYYQQPATPEGHYQQQQPPVYPSAAVEIQDESKRPRF